MGPPAITLLLSGLPRAGTTLLCALLNECAETVALAEPLLGGRDGDRAWLRRDLESLAAATRHLAPRGGRVISRHVGGTVPDNWMSAPTADAAPRRQMSLHGLVRLARPVNPGFTLVIKENELFVALLPELTADFPVMALLRDPLAVLAGWQTVPLPVGAGRLPRAEALAPALAAALARRSDRLARQIVLLDWLWRGLTALPPERVLRYEDLMVAPVATLGRLTPHPWLNPRPLRAVDPRQRYPGVDLAPLAEALWPLRREVERFYPDFTARLALHFRPPLVAAPRSAPAEEA